MQKRFQGHTATDLVHEDAVEEDWAAANGRGDERHQFSPSSRRHLGRRPSPADERRTDESLSTKREKPTDRRTQVIERNTVKIRRLASRRGVYGSRLMKPTEQKIPAIGRRKTGRTSALDALGIWCLLGFMPDRIAQCFGLFPKHQLQKRLEPSSLVSRLLPATVCTFAYAN